VATQVQGCQVQAGHQCGAGHRWLRADQQHVQPDAAQGEPISSPLAQQSPKSPGEQCSYDGQVGAADDQDMAGAGCVKQVIKVTGDAGLDARMMPCNSDASGSGARRAIAARAQSLTANKAALIGLPWPSARSSMRGHPMNEWIPGEPNSPCRKSFPARVGFPAGRIPAAGRHSGTLQAGARTRIVP